MKNIFYNKKISGILSILPSKKVTFSDEVGEYPFPEKQSLKLAKVMGFDTRRVCDPGDSLCDYAIFGINYLISHGYLIKDDIDAIVVSTSSQDYLMPPASYLIQGLLKLNNETLCFDISQACGGYIAGLIQSFMLIDTYKLKKVLLVTGDFLSKKAGKRDRSSRPILGDAVNVSIVENSEAKNTISSVWRNFGESAKMIMIPAGGTKQPSNQETAKDFIDAFGNYRSLDNFYMDGEEVFNFVMREAPSVIHESIKALDWNVENVDYFLFHQPNRYMVQKLCDEADLPYEKTFSNIVSIYGNSSTGTVPLNICHNISKEVLSKALNVCLSGFGAGLTCNAMAMKMEKMDFCKIIDYQR